MTSMVAALRISLGLDSAAFDTGVRKAGASVNALGVDMQRARSNFAAFEGGLLGTTGAAQRTGTALVQVKDKSGQMQAGMQQLGFQLQDITAQFSTGTKASVIFAQQGGQLISSLTMMAQATGKTTGLLGGLATFMSGPWGAAVGVAAGLAGVLIERLYATGTAGESAAAGLKTAAAAARELIGAENALKLVEKQGELNKARDRRLELELDIQKRGRPNSNGQMQFVYKQQQELQQVRWQIAQLENEIALAEAENARIMRTANSGVGSGGARASGGGGRAASVREIGDAARGAKKDVDSLQAALDELEAMKVEMRKGGLFASLSERGDVTGKIRADTGLIEVDLAKIGKGLDALYDDMRGFENKASTVTVSVAESFKDMATNTLSALQSVTNALKGGDFLDVLSSVLNLGLQLAGSGAFGSDIQASVNKVPGRAVGGPVSHNRLYVVGERGPELFMPGGSGTIIPNHRLGDAGGGNTYYLQGNLLTPEFWQRITSQDMQAAQAGGELGYRKVIAKSRRRLS